MSFPSFQSGDRFGAVESAYHELRAWLTTKISWFEQAQLLQSKSDSAASMDYEEYLRFRSVSQVAIDHRCVVRRKVVGNANNVLTFELWLQIGLCAPSRGVRTLEASSGCQQGRK